MKNVVICVSLNDECLKSLEHLKSDPVLDNARVHLVHCFEVQVYTSDFSPYIYPTEEKYPEIEAASLKILEGLEAKLGLNGKAVKKCFFSQSPKQRLRDYLEEENADLCVLATRGKHGIKGLFSSSFAEHLVKYSPCSLHILRPEES
ncbi:MAG: universal stress protein [Bacteriovoracaceae bacterium]|nr:universal stress protein [Bacteriovoracaceae bacterium]